MAKAKQQSPVEGARFVRYFGPLLDALRGLGGSGSPEEVVERIASDLKLSDDVQNELLPSGEPRYRNQVHWAQILSRAGGFARLLKTRRLEPHRARSCNHADSFAGPREIFLQVGPDLSRATPREGERSASHRRGRRRSWPPRPPSDYEAAVSGGSP